MNILLGVLIGLFCLLFLVTAHEFGHFIMARKNGVKVLEVGIGFPPRAIAWVTTSDGKWQKLKKSDWKKPQSGLVFSLNWLPIGGFCQMDGESDADDRKGTFGASSFWAKTKILFGGVLMNWLVAFLTFTILAWTGMPIFLDHQFSVESDRTLDYTPVTVTSVVENSPAARAGIKPQDHILKANGEELISATDLTEFNAAHAGETVTFEIQHAITAIDGNSEPSYFCNENPTGSVRIVSYCPEEIEITLNDKDNEWGYYLGVTMASDTVYAHYTWSAPIVGLGTTLQLTGETFRGVGVTLWNLVSGAFSQLSFDGTTREAGRAAISTAGDSVTGPVGIIGVIFPAFAKTGFNNIAFLFALISVSLACMNVLPVPALDGGRWLMIAIARLRHKRLTKETEDKIVSRALIVLLGLMVLITILDITRFF